METNGGIAPRILSLLVHYFMTSTVSRPYIVEWEADRLIGNDLEGSGHGLTGVLACNLPEGPQ
jgi:hypothetical protein